MAAIAAYKSIEEQSTAGIGMTWYEVAVVTNYRYDEIFKAEAVHALFSNEPLRLMCQLTGHLQDSPETFALEVKIEQISNPYGVLSCDGFTEGALMRIEETAGTLYVSWVRSSA